MHAYFPALNSFPSLLGDMLADAIGCLGFTWVCMYCLELAIEAIVAIAPFFVGLFRRKELFQKLLEKHNFASSFTPPKRNCSQDML